MTSFSFCLFYFANYFSNWNRSFISKLIFSLYLSLFNQIVVEIKRNFHFLTYFLLGIWMEITSHGLLRQILLVFDI